MFIFDQTSEAALFASGRIKKNFIFTGKVFVFIRYKASKYDSEIVKTMLAFDLRSG